MKKPTFFLIFFLCKIFVGFAQNTSEDAISVASKEIIQAESTRFGMMTTKDIAGLERLLADELTYVHATGLVETKKEFLASLQANKVLYKSIQARDVSVRIYGTTAIVNGTATIKAWTKAGDREMQVRYIEAYIKEEDSWKLTAWQSTLITP